MKQVSEKTGRILGGISGFLFGKKRSYKQHITETVTGVLLFCLIVLSFVFVRLHADGQIASVSADSDKQTESETIVSFSDSFFGHLYIDNDPDGIIETGNEPEASVELCHLSFELHPDNETKETSVTLYGMMPEGATAEAVDVTQQYPDANHVSEETSDDATVIAAYDITITDGENEFQPSENRPIRVEITNPQIVPEGITEIWHIRDDGSRERITDFTVSDGKIGFFALGFSVYAIVNGPEPYVSEGMNLVESVSDLTGERALSGFYLFYRNSSGKEVFYKNTVNSKGCLVETQNMSSASVWYFEPYGNNYQLYSVVNGVKKYVRNTTEFEVELADGSGDTIEVSEAGVTNAFLLKKTDELKWLQHSGRGGGIRYWSDVVNTTNSRMYMYFVDNGTPPDDYYGMDGKSWGLLNHSEGIEGNALMADENSNSLSMMTLLVRTDEQRDTLFVAEDSDITMWTFHIVNGDIYKISANVGSIVRYLRIGDTITLTDESQASEIRVIPKDGMVRLGSKGKYITYSDGRFISAESAPEQRNQWLV